MSNQIKFYYKKPSINKNQKQEFSNTLYTIKTPYLSNAVRECIIQLKAAEPESITAQVRICYINDDDYAKIRREVIIDSRILPNTANDYVCIYESTDNNILVAMIRPECCRTVDKETFDAHVIETKEKLERLTAIKEAELGTLTYETFKPVLRKLVDKAEGFDKSVLPKMYKDFKNQVIHLTVKEWATEYMKDWTLAKEKLALLKIAE